MSSEGIARAKLDRAGGLIQTGATTVMADGDDSKWWVATEGSMIGTPPNKGDVIVKSQTTVYAEKNKVAIKGAITATGRNVSSNSTTVFAGDNGSDAIVIVDKDDIDDGTKEGQRAAIQHLESYVKKGTLDSEIVKRSLNSKAQEEDAAKGKAIPGKSQFCTEIHSMKTFPLDLKISKYFTLENMLRTWIDGRTIDFPHHKLKTNKGFSVDQIVCNLSLLCKNVLDPLYEKYKDWIITNSFREGQDQAQHGNGQACDLKFNTRSVKLHYERCQWMRDNLPYDQLLLEYRDQGKYLQNWIHVSFVANDVYRNRNGSGPKGCRPDTDINKIGTLYNDLWKSSKLQLY